MFFGGTIYLDSAVSAAKFKSSGDFPNQDLNIFAISHRNFQ